MSTKQLKRLNLPPKIIETLDKHNIHSCKDVLILSRLELLNCLGVSDKKREEAVQTVSRACCPDPCTAYALHVQNQSSLTKCFLPSFLTTFDNILLGGIPCSSITELAGPPSVGKTQLCLQLCVSATLPTELRGFDGAVAYIDTELAFSAHRLKEIALSRFPEYFQSEANAVRMMQRIYVYQVLTAKALQNLMQDLESEVIRKGIKLIIIDSIASIPRKEFSTSSLESLVFRNNLLMEQAAAFKNLAETFKIVVFVTNQVTSETGLERDVVSADSEEEEDTTPSELPASTSDEQKVSRDHVVPAMGLTWSHCVTTRLVAQFVDCSKRQLMVVKSPLATNAAVCYTITQSGLNLTEDPVQEMKVDPHQTQIRTKSSFLSLNSLG